MVSVETPAAVDVVSSHVESWLSHTSLRSARGTLARSDRYVSICPLC